jgi:hypothetical protein
VSVPRFRIIRSQAEAINAEVVREVGARVDEGGKAQGRICGDCRLCCKTLEVPELQKPAGKWCGHAYLETGALNARSTISDPSRAVPSAACGSPASSRTAIARTARGS